MWEAKAEDPAANHVAIDEDVFKKWAERRTRCGICDRPTTFSTTAICSTSCPFSTGSSASPVCAWRVF
jgi:hypothetical protein